MKTKNLILLFIFALILVVACNCCKKKEVPVVKKTIYQPPPQTQEEFFKSFTKYIVQLQPGQEIQVSVNKREIITGESGFIVSLFPEDFVAPEERPYVFKYLLPSVVYRGEKGSPQLEVPNNNWCYIRCVNPGTKIAILKESGDLRYPFKQKPNLLVQNLTKDKFWVLDQNGVEMPLRPVSWTDNPHL